MPSMEGFESSGGFSGGSSRFELLDGTNWYSWKYRMEMHLFRKDLWLIVDKSEPRPAQGARAQAAWDKRAKLAAAEIALHVADSQLPLIRKTTDPCEMWRILKETHENAGWANRMALMRRFLLLRKAEGDTMQGHINTFIEHSQALTDVGVELPDMLKVTVLLASLPDDYENIITAIESHIEATAASTEEQGESATDKKKDPKLDFDYVTRRLLNEEKRRALVSDSLGERAMVAKRRQRREDVTCFQCKKQGHYRNECPELQKSQQTPQEDKADVAQDFAF